MTTSGITAWSLTARELVRQSLVETGILSSGEDPTADEETDCIARLNGMLKSWQNKGAGLWLESDQTAIVLADADSVALSAGIREVLSARVVVSATHERPLAMIERDDYLTIPNKATSSAYPTSVYPAKGLSGITLYVWPVPSANVTLALDCLRGVETVVDAGETLDFPEEYQETIWQNLAVRCARIFGKQAPPELVISAAELERQLFDAERPGSYFMGPAYSSPYYR